MISKKVLLESLGLLAWLYIVVFLIIVGLQRKLLYHPYRAELGKLKALAHSKNMAPWVGAGGEVIGWKRAIGNGESVARVVMFHGNGGMALDRDYFLDGLPGVGETIEAYVFEYPGYGARGGKCSEKTFVAAAADALELLRQQNGKPIFFVGESLGCAVAAQVAAQKPDALKGLFLIVPFNNLGDAAAAHFPLFPLRWFLFDRYAPDAALKHYGGPVAVMIAEWDLTVPRWLGKKLYNSYRGPKKLIFIPGAGHNSINFSPQQPWWREIWTFLNEPDRLAHLKENSEK